MKKNYLIGLLLVGGWTPALNAAPLDVMLTAAPHRAGTTRLEIAYDAVNNTLDVFGVRAKDPVYGGTNVGDYNGFHLRGGYGLTDRLWLEGGLWQRKIAYQADTENITSWQTAAQYQLNDGNRRFGQYAVRLGIWGNSAPTINKSTPTVMQNLTLQSVSVAQPQDIQLQADVIGTWPLTKHTKLSAFVGAGASRVTVGGLSGIVNGCNYNVVSSALGTAATLTAPCGNLLTATITSPSTLGSSLSYASHYYQAGGNLQWAIEKWQLSAGYQFQYLNRSEVDAVIVQRGGIAYQSNHIVVAEVARKVARGLIVFVRGQAMNNQFVGEMPFSYNSVTASKFGRMYGFASFGARLDF